MTKDACMYTCYITRKPGRQKRKSHKTRQAGLKQRAFKPLGFDSAVPAARTKDQGRVKFHEKSQDRDRGRERYNSRSHTVTRLQPNPSLLRGYRVFPGRGVQLRFVQASATCLCIGLVFDTCKYQTSEKIKAKRASCRNLALYHTVHVPSVYANSTYARRGAFLVPSSTRNCLLIPMKSLESLLAALKDF